MLGLHVFACRSPFLEDQKTTFFSDADFKAKEKQEAKKGEEKLTYKNFIRKTLMKEGADAIAREEEEMETKKKRKKTPAEEQRDLQAELRAAAHSGDDDQDLFSLKEHTAEEKQQEDEEFAKFQAQGERRADNAENVMSNYWRADEDLDEDERFLRDYVMNRQWLEIDSLQASSSRPAADALDLDEEQDDDDLEEADEFEKDYNFRFEMEDGRPGEQGQKGREVQSFSQRI